VEEFGDFERERPYYEVSFRALRNDAGERVGTYQFVTDVSERLREQAQLADAQEALRQSQKLEAMGQLTGGVSHDFNNLLTPIIGSLDLLQRTRVGNERQQRLIDGALQSAERAKTLVQRLLAFARRQPLQAKAVDVAALVEGIADLVASTTGPRVRVELEIAPELPAAKADANQLEMALLNLAVNARDAMPHGGILTISAKPVTAEAGNRLALDAGTYVRLAVADNGTGMDEATLARAIEPFFSTKGVGRGTGLGLSMVHGLAAQLGGSLDITSNLGSGTTVELWLPVTAEAVARPERTERPDAPAAVGRVLLVDDEELVRATTSDMLTELGYAVVQAGSAEDALRLLDSSPAVDLLVTDHLMPGMTGTELAQVVRSRRPEMPVLLVSGYAESAGIAADLPRLTKPFRQSDLALSMAMLAADL
jgi:signal transduction histidine kinase